MQGMRGCAERAPESRGVEGLRAACAKSLAMAAQAEV